MVAKMHLLERQAPRVGPQELITMIDSVPEHRRCLIEFAAHSRILRAGAGEEEDNLGALARYERCRAVFSDWPRPEPQLQSSTRLFSIRRRRSPVDA